MFARAVAPVFIGTSLNVSLCLCPPPRRDGVIAVGKDASQFTDEYLPDQRSHLYGIAIATSHCLPGETGEALLFAGLHS